MNVLVQGDPMDPCNTDLIAQVETLEVGKPVPFGWRVLTGNMHFSQIARVAYRDEVESDDKA